MARRVSGEAGPTGSMILSKAWFLLLLLIIWCLDHPKFAFHRDLHNILPRLCYDDHEEKPSPPVIPSPNSKFRFPEILRELFWSPVLWSLHTSQKEVLRPRGRRRMSRRGERNQYPLHSVNFSLHLN